MKSKIQRYCSDWQVPRSGSEIEDDDRSIVSYFLPKKKGLLFIVVSIAFLLLSSCDFKIDPKSLAVYTPTQMEGSGAVEMATGSHHSCMLADAKVYCWGQNPWGQLGIGGDATNRVTKDKPTEVTKLSDLNPTAITAGRFHSCAISNDDLVYCWGWDHYGQLGNRENNGYELEPVIGKDENGEEYLIEAREIAAGSDHTCALANEDVWCWGGNQFGQLGVSNQGVNQIEQSPTPLLVLEGGTKLSAGGFNTCAIKNGQVICWGSNHKFTRAISDPQKPEVSWVVSRPTTINGLKDATDIAVGGNHMCAIADGGKVFCWGRNKDGQLGIGSRKDKEAPTEVIGLSNATEITAGYKHTCAIANGGKAFCWGHNDLGQTGSGLNRLKDTVTSPKEVDGSEVPAITGTTKILQYKSISAGFDQTCAVGTGSTGGDFGYCWGANHHLAIGLGVQFPAAKAQVVRKGDAIPDIQLAQLAPDPMASHVAVGRDHTCSLVDGGVKCWGSDSSGQVGNGSAAGGTTPVDAIGLTSGVTAITSGDWHSCALTTEGGVKCWGRNNQGQLGDGTQTNRFTPIDVPGLSSGVTAISAGTNNTCAIVSGGAKCWGMNNFGQIGDGSGRDVTHRLTPTDVLGLDSGVIAISTGQSHVCALITGGSAKCWGNNVAGQFGTGTATPFTTENFDSTPVDAGTGFTYSSIRSGEEITCAITSGGVPKCWGEDISLSPTDVPGSLTGVTSIVGGNTFNQPSEFYCALVNGGVKCWGKNEAGQLGDGTEIDRATPVDVTGLTSGVTDLSIGWESRQLCAVQNGSIKCWGGDFYGKLVNGKTFGGSSTPLFVSFGVERSSVSTIKASREHTCAITAEGGAACWGTNAYGQLGLGESSKANPYLVEYQPENVEGLTSGVTAIGTGLRHTCAIVNNGISCWGNFEYNNSLVVRGDGEFSPQAAPFLTTNQKALVSGNFHNCSLSFLGSVSCWGNNSAGQLGIGTTTVPGAVNEVIGLSTGVIDIAAGFEHSCALIEDGTVKCWGSNHDGSLGDGTTTRRTSPVNVTGITDAVSITAGGYHTCAITVSDGAFCWGTNTSGELGDGSQANRLTPVAVSGLPKNLAAISAGDTFTCALTTFGKPYCWGANYASQLGDETLNQSSTPVEVIGLPNGITSISTGAGHSCVQLGTGKLSCWGNNEYGQLGIGSPFTPEEFVQTMPVTGRSASLFFSTNKAVRPKFLVVAEQFAKMKDADGIARRSPNSPQDDHLITQQFADDLDALVEVINEEWPSDEPEFTEWLNSAHQILDIQDKVGEPIGTVIRIAEGIPVNEGPTFEDMGFFTSIFSSDGAKVGILEAIDLDGESITYEIIEGNTDSTFALDSETGELTIANSSNLSQEAYSFTVMASDDGYPVYTDTATITITATNASILSMDQAAYSVDEGEGTVSVTVQLSPQASETVTVAYATSGGSAIAGSDYFTATGMLTFEAGETTKTIMVNVDDDGKTESDETFVVTLSDPANAILGLQEESTVTIVDDDVVDEDQPTVNFNPTDYSTSEDQATVTLTVELDKASATELSIGYSTSDGTAAAGVDYVAKSGTVTFAAGETSKSIEVSLVDDDVVESDEAFSLTLIDPANVFLGSSNAATITITDNDDETTPPTSDTRIFLPLITR